MIRIEDTDQARSSDESARGILDDLAWLGIEWDDGPTHTHANREIGTHSRPVGPYFQARRVHIYNAYIEDLIKRGRAYPAFENSEELDTKRKAAVAAKQTYRYARPDDVKPGIFNEARWARAQSGETHVVRFLALSEEIVVEDQVLGDVRIAPGELDDFVIRKADGFPTYHFAVVVDDELMGVTHVMRAQEHLANTPRHVAMQKAMVRLAEWETPGRRAGAPFAHPVYAHMPLIFNNDGTKMSKRDKAKAARKAAKDAISKNSTITAASLATDTGLPERDISLFLAAESDSIDTAEALARRFGVALPEIEVWDFRRNGYLPETITNFVALLGWNPGMKTEDGKDLEKFDMPFIAKHFGIERIGKTNSKFDRAKLLSFSADAIGAMTDGAFVDRWLAWLAEYEPAAHARVASLGTDRQLTLARALRPRAKTLRDALRPIGFLLSSDTDYTFDTAAVEKSLLASDRAGLTLLRTMRDRLDTISESDWRPELIQSLIEQVAQQNAGADNKPALGAVSQAVRVAITGTTVSPGLGETLAVLGRQSSLARIDRCLATFTP
jgi:glutamyl-tRNA synthetase